MASTIRTLASVRAARVHLVLPRREIFSRDKQEPSASIALKLKGSEPLNLTQVGAIQSLVAAAVPGLVPGHVSIVDNRGNLLTRAARDGKDGEQTAASMEEMKHAYEQRMARTIEDLIGRSIGLGKVRAEVTADTDFDRITSTAELFDPESQVVRSTQSTQETSESTNASNQTAVSVTENLPSGDTKNNTPRSGNASARTEEVVNHEISKTVKNHIRETGGVKHFSVAVLVDGKYTAGADGARTYQPQEQATLDQIATQLKSAVGFDAKRGDTVEVVKMQFAEPDAIPEGNSSFLDGLGFSDYMKFAETMVLLIISILAMLLIIRLTPKRLMGSPVTADQPQSTHQLAAPRPDGAAGQEALTDVSAAALPPPNDGPIVENEMIDIQNIEGRVRASLVRKIGQIVDRHPIETANIIHTWMVEQA